MDTADKTLLVCWCAPPAHLPEPPDGLSIRSCLPNALDPDGTNLMILDQRAFESAKAMMDARLPHRLPALLLARPESIAELLPALTAQDEIALIGSPLNLIEHRLGQLVGRASTWRDSLTGLADRQSFLERLRLALDDASPENPVSVLFIDIDRFKHINDTHGHSVGDTILHRLARRIVTRTSPQAFVARFGGDQLVALMVAGETDALAEGELIGDVVRRKELLEGIAVTVSVGVATTVETVGRRELLGRAEEAVYAAKSQGRDRVIHSGELRRRAMAEDAYPAIESFENLTQVMAERIAEVITHRGRRLFEQLRREAEVDVLTRLYNRRYLDRRLAYAFASSSSSGQPLTVALLDIDHFGQVNKRHGWPSGDKILREVSEVITSGVRGGDWVARYGGEEICVVMHHARLEDAEVALERLRKSIDDHRFEAQDGTVVPLAVSIGAAERQDTDGSVRDQMERVSDRLLWAKRNGRNRVCARVVEDESD